MYQLYYYPLNASMAPHFVLQAIGVPFKAILLDRNKQHHKSSEYLALNPLGRIPTLVKDDLIITESAAICLYLAERYSEAGLIPDSEDVKRGKCYQWLMFLTNTLQAEIMISEYPSRYVSPDQTQALLANQETRIGQLLKQIDSHLSEHVFFLGNDISVCDFYFFMLAIWADELERPPLAYPNIARQLRYMAQQEAVINVCEKEGFSLRDYQ
ncbi:glutathione S-transferase [Marinomonas sp. SBI22]|uniref:glutathione S-transferase family protein n=1 Tax=unclassified Marinomonas TaxID=196814 RepID=UPI0007AF33D4|nr:MULTISPECIES: glutathione S-transferase family protein [unclassified Marinomonas]KZM40855.1 glutathione S-transferase [Marinomonas sp. SBI22]KZM42695.1 glutathione S-transferase [Marinomonas sp. SBI8L]